MRCEEHSQRRLRVRLRRGQEPGFANEQAQSSLRPCPCSRLRQAKPGSSFAMAKPPTGEL